MKVEENARRGKKKAGRGRRESNLQSADLVVTVPNEDSSSSRLKPPVTSSQPRKIVRLNRKSESTDLEKVTVKSLDEIKREKQQRLKESPLPTSADPDGAQSHDAVDDVAPVSSSGNNTNHPGDNGSKPAKVEASCSSGHSSVVRPTPPLKNLTIPLKALPTSLPSLNCKILSSRQPNSTATSSLKQGPEVTMDFERSLSEQDFDNLDDSDVSSFDEDYLLGDSEEEEPQQNSQRLSSKSQNHPYSNEESFHAYMDHSDIQRTQDYAGEKDDDNISLHPDDVDSLFDEGDDLGANNDRVRPRSFGKRSGSETGDLRLTINDSRQRQSGSSDKTKEEPVTESKETCNQERNREAFNEKHEQVSRHKSKRSSSRQEDDRWKRPLSARGGKRRGGMQAGNNLSRRGGHRSRQGPRRESGPEVSGPVPSLLGIPAITPLLNTGDGLLPFPGADILTPLQARLQEAIQNNVKKTVEMLTNPPPVPGEVVPEYDNHRRPPVQHGSQSTCESGKTSQRHLPKRSHSSTQDVNSMRTPTPEDLPSKSQGPHPKNTPGRKIPKWLVRMKETIHNNEQKVASEGNSSQYSPGNTAVMTGGEVPQRETTDTAETTYRHDAVLPGVHKDSTSRPITDVEKARLAALRPTRSSPLPDCSPDAQAATSKRKSPFHGEETPHGGKIVVTTSPEGLPQPNLARKRKSFPKGYCFEQLNTGKCTKTICKYEHMDGNELQEFQGMQQSAIANSNVNDVEAQPQVQIEQTVAVHETQPQEEDPVESYKLVTELLTNKNLRGAWQMVEKLCRTNRPDLDIVRRILVICSEHVEEPAIAAQVAHMAFDMINRVSGQHHRHDYTVLIRSLCHAGQYIRAYEMLDVMKRNNHMPTYEVFLDLIQASVKDPDWAFNLLGEIKQSGLFKSGICSDLILLGCNSGQHFVPRTWSLFQEALQYQVQLSSDAALAMLYTLSQANDWGNIMSIIPVFPQVVPTEMLKTAVLTAPKKPEWIEMVAGLLGVTPAEKLVELGPDVWNSFLCSCCLASTISCAQKVYSLMLQNEIPLEPQPTNAYMSALCHANNWSGALELFHMAQEDPKVIEQPLALESGLIALSAALSKAKASVSMLNVVHFMLGHWIKPGDSVLQSAVEMLDKEKNYKGVLQFFHQLEAANIVLPEAVYKQIILSLEKWVENPTASIEPYAAMRRAYSATANQSETINKEEVSSCGSSKSQVHSYGKVCHFFNTPQGCRYGDKCRFIHQKSIVNMQENSNSVFSAGTSLQSNETVSHPQPGNPFVFRDPCSFPGQAVGPGLFGSVQDQQHTATSSSTAKVGLHLGGPFSSNRQVPPVVHPVPGGTAHNFQLAGASHFTGKNPFSPSLPGRANSMDGLVNGNGTEQQNRQTRSAPVIAGDPSSSYFQYPSKKSAQFYLPRIKHASQQNSWEDLGSVYVAMKNEDVDIDYDVLQAFFQAFEVHCLPTVGESFEKFSSKIHDLLEQTMPKSEPDCSPSASLDDDDKCFIGQLGVALMYLMYSKQLFNQGYTVLHVLHNFSINYSMYTGEFGVQQRPLTPCEVALTAADICLNSSQPLYSSALEVLRGTNYACAANETILTFKEIAWRRRVFKTLCEYFLSSKEFSFVFELLDKVGDVEIFGGGDVKTLYNKLLHGLISNQQLDNVTELLKIMEEKHISWEPSSVRALVDGFGEAGIAQQAKFFFKKGVYTGVYPDSFSTSDPWTVTVGISLSALECQFYIERHLHLLSDFVKQAFSSGGGLLDDKYYNPLRVVIKSDEVPNLYTRDEYMRHDDVIRVMREKVSTVLTDDFNPPLSCTAEGKDEELLVSALSLKRWFRANPTTGRFKGGSWGTPLPFFAKSLTYVPSRKNVR